MTTCQLIHDGLCETLAIEACQLEAVHKAGVLGLRVDANHARGGLQGQQGQQRTAAVSGASFAQRAWHGTAAALSLRVHCSSWQLVPWRGQSPMDR